MCAGLSSIPRMVVEEIVLADNLTSQAYKLEYRRLEEMVYGGKRQQLWNVIPHTSGQSDMRSAAQNSLTV
jgi:hypothetical protein